MGTLIGYVAACKAPIFKEEKRVYHRESFVDAAARVEIDAMTSVTACSFSNRWIGILRPESTYWSPPHYLGTRRSSRLEKILHDAHDRTRVRIAAYCLMPKLWQLLLCSKRRKAIGGYALDHGHAHTALACSPNERTERPTDRAVAKIGS